MSENAYAVILFSFACILSITLLWTQTAVSLQDFYTHLSFMKSQFS